MNMIFSLPCPLVTALGVAVLRWEWKDVGSFTVHLFIHKDFSSWNRFFVLNQASIDEPWDPVQLTRGWGGVYTMELGQLNTEIDPAFLLPLLQAVATPVASSFSKLLILLLAHLEALFPSRKSNSTVCATRLVADDQWHSWDGTGGDTLSPPLWNMGVMDAE